MVWRVTRDETALVLRARQLNRNNALQMLRLRGSRTCMRVSYRILFNRACPKFLRLLLSVKLRHCWKLAAKNYSSRVERCRWKGSSFCNHGIRVNAAKFMNKIAVCTSVLTSQRSSQRSVYYTQPTNPRH